jgi:hypothetical protein
MTDRDAEMTLTTFAGEGPRRRCPVAANLLGIIAPPAETLSAGCVIIVSATRRCAVHYVVPRRIAAPRDASQTYGTAIAAVPFSLPEIPAIGPPRDLRNKRL